MSELTLVASLFGPLFVRLVFHGLCIKFGWLRSRAVPIDRKTLFRGRALFGAVLRKGSAVLYELGGTTTLTVAAAPGYVQDDASQEQDQRIDTSARIK